MPCRSNQTIFSLVLVLLAFSQQNSAQVNAEQLREADDLFGNASYASALPTYLRILEKEPEQPLFNYKAGVCYLFSRSQKPKAVPYLEKAVNNSASFRTKGYAAENEAPLNAVKLLGDAYYVSHNFPQAINAYENYKTLLKERKNPDMAELAATDIKLEMCRLLKELKPKVTLPVSAGTGQPCSGDLAAGQYTRTLSADKTSMIYTVKVPVDKKTLSDEAAIYYEPMASGKPDSAGRNKPASTKPAKKFLEIDTVVYASTIGTSYDGQVVLSYKNDDGEGNLYIIRLKDNKWTAPQKMPKCSNKKGWETHESLSADGSEMYFVSEQPTGFGGKDIYKCKRLPNGEWSKAVNLGPAVNGPADEVAPFIHPNGRTLYFSSNRIKPGSFDIFASTLKTGQWEQPVNVGYPINRHDHDIFQVTADNKTVFPAGKPGAEQLKKTKNADTTSGQTHPDRSNYLISFVDQQQKALTVLKGQVTDLANRNPLGARITITDNGSGEVIGSYHADSKTGLYSFMLPVGRNVGISYEREGYLFQTEQIEITAEKSYFDKQRLVKLPLLAESATTTLSSIFYDGNGTTPTGLSQAEINRLIDFLNANPAVSIDITNHIYSEKDKGFNRKLSAKRAETLGKVLTDKGIHPARIRTEGVRHSMDELVKKEKKKTGKKIKKNPAQHTMQPRTQVVEISIRHLGAGKK